MCSAHEADVTQTLQSKQWVASARELASRRACQHPPSNTASTRQRLGLVLEPWWNGPSMTGIDPSVTASKQHLTCLSMLLSDWSGAVACRNLRQALLQFWHWDGNAHHVLRIPPIALTVPSLTRSTVCLTPAETAMYLNLPSLQHREFALAMCVVAESCNRAGFVCERRGFCWD